MNCKWYMIEGFHFNARIGNGSAWLILKNTTIIDWFSNACYRVKYVKCTAYSVFLLSFLITAIYALVIRPFVNSNPTKDGNKNCASMGLIPFKGDQRDFNEWQK